MPPRIYFIQRRTSNCLSDGNLLPFQIIVDFGFCVFIFKLREINFWHQVVFDMIHGLIERIGKLEEVLLIKKDLMLLVREVVAVHPSFALGDRDVEVVGAGRLDVKKISSFSCFYFF